MSCANTFHDFISNCNTALKVNALLQPATSYTWSITDKFGKEYNGIALTDDQGFLSIQIADLPAGFFTEFSGAWKLQILDGDCHELDFKMAKFYDSIEFQAIGGSRVKDSLGCNFDCNLPSGSSGNSAVFPFSGVGTLHIEWTALLETLYGNAPNVAVYLLIGPGQYQLTTVSIVMNGGPYNLQSIDADFGGTADGYLLLSN